MPSGWFRDFAWRACQRIDLRKMASPSIGSFNSAVDGRYWHIPALGLAPMCWGL
jgi:hypothetical protein